jgi:hypothetical protein
VALLNPTVNGDIALLVSEEQNALIDNGEGLYQAGIPLFSEPPHLPLSVEADLLYPAGPPYDGPTFDWTGFKSYGGNYAQFGTFQTVPFTIKNAPSTFTLDTQHYATSSLEIDAAGNNGNLLTLIVGDSTGGEDFGPLHVEGYSTVHIVDNGAGDSSITPDFSVVGPSVGGIGPVHLVVSGSGSGFLDLGTAGSVYDVSTITDVGQRLFLGSTGAQTIDASNAPLLGMLAPVRYDGGFITVLGGTSNNQLQGSFAGDEHVNVFGNGTGVYYDAAGADNITGGPGGNDLILGDGGSDIITLPPSHSMIDSIGFGYDLLPAGGEILAITDGSDNAYPGYWGITRELTPPNRNSRPLRRCSRWRNLGRHDDYHRLSCRFRRRPAHLRHQGLEWSK